MFPQLDYGTIKLAQTPQICARGEIVDLLKKGGYASIYERPLEIKIAPSGKSDNKIYCKVRGYADQGYRHD